MGRWRCRNRRRRKNNRKKESVQQNTSVDVEKSESYFTTSDISLPVGAYVDLKSFTTISLFVGNSNSRNEWTKIRLQLILFYPKEAIFNNIEKCITYIKRKRINRLYLQLFKCDDTITIKEIRAMIVKECYRNQLTHFYINRVNDMCSGFESIRVQCSHDEDCEKRKFDDSEMPVPIAIYGLTHGEQKSIRDLTKDEVSFMWFQLLIDVLLRLPKDTAEMSDMLRVARAHYSADPIELKKIDDFAYTYTSEKAIWWYTQDSFVYRLLNSAFRTQDIRIIFAFRFYIIDLHEKLMEAAAKDIDRSGKTVFRGQLLPIDELETIKKNVGGLISMNTFLSTTLDCQVACMYTGYDSNSSTHAAVIFEILLTSKTETTAPQPFVSVAQYSDKHDENEILFTMGCIFRIISIEQYGSICLVNLEIHAQPKQCMSELSSYLYARHEGLLISELTLGNLLLDMGEIKQALQFYSIMIGQQDPEYAEIEIALLQNSIGVGYIDKGDYKSARLLFEQAIDIAKHELWLKTVLLNNLGLALINLGHLGRALRCFKRAKKYNRSKKDRLILYSNIGSVYMEKGQYEKAKQYVNQELAMSQKYLPPSHPGLGESYTHLAVLEMKMGNYNVALELLEKALNIYRRSLPPNHHLFANVLNNLGAVYDQMDDFDRARTYYEEALKIQSVSYGKDAESHLLVTKTLNNIATCQFENKDYQSAEKTFQQVLNTRIAILGDDSKMHPSLSTTFNNLAMTQLKQTRLDEALANFSRALEIEQSMGDTDSIAITYNNIAGVYREKGDFSNAQHWFSKAYSTALTVLPENHPSVQLYKSHMKDAAEKVHTIDKSD